MLNPPEKREPNPIKREVKLLSDQTIGSFGKIPVKTFVKPSTPALQSVAVLPIEVSNAEESVATPLLWS